MALTECAECGRGVSTKAEACPHCGVPSLAPDPSDTARSSVASRVLIAFGLVFLGGLGGLMVLDAVYGAPTPCGALVERDVAWFEDARAPAVSELDPRSEGRRLLAISVYRMDREDDAAHMNPLACAGKLLFSDPGR